MVSIAIVGNCQTFSVASALARMLPHETITHVALRDVRASGNDLEGRLVGSEHVLLQAVGSASERAALASQAAASGAKVTQFPAIAFSGFHPDCVYVQSPTGIVRSPLGDMHSGIIGGAFLAGTEIGRVPALFNNYVFARLGYFDRYAQARRLLEEEAAALDFDLAFLFSSDGPVQPFMHTINHPTIEVIARVARAAAAKAGLIEADAPLPRGLKDGLAVTHWPTYPGLARRLSLPGDMTFKSRGVPGIDLDTLIERSYALYGRINRKPAMTRNLTMRAAADLFAAEVR